MTILTRTLNALGLMTRAEHEAVTRRADADKQLIEHLRADVVAYDAKFKTAVTDLEKQAAQLESLTTANALLTKEVYSLRPDALAMRRKRQMDRDRRKKS